VCVSPGADCVVNLAYRAMNGRSGSAGMRAALSSSMMTFRLFAVVIVGRAMK
jgi:hypothetical protein